MKKNFSNCAEWICFCLLVTTLVFTCFFKDFSYATTDGIKLFVACVLPALFPYLFITTLLTSLSVTGRAFNKLSPITSKLFNVSGCVGYAFFISVLSGYPMGAKMVSDLKSDGLLSDAEAVRASAICSTSSPVFLISSVGNLTFRNSLFGKILFLTHLISALITGAIFSLYKRKSKPNSNAFTPTLKNDNILYQATFSSVISVLVVGGLITVFYILTEILSSLNVLSLIISPIFAFSKNSHIAEGLAFGLFECTKGIKRLAVGGISLFTLPVCAFICGFGGLSVICQSIAYLKKAKIKTAPFVLSKLTSAVINFIVGLIFSICFFAR